MGPQGSGWFHVAPTLSAGGVTVPLDGVMCQTVLSKCLGPLPRWLNVLRVAHEAGFNMVHFTPVQVCLLDIDFYTAKTHLMMSTQLLAGLDLVM